jgi:hypothetical protein
MQERTLVVLLQVQRRQRYREVQVQVQGQGQSEEDVREDTGGTVTGTEGAQSQVQRGTGTGLT